MGIPVNRDKKHEFFNVSGSLHFPQPAISFSWAAFPDPAERRNAPLPASPFTPELHHGTGQIKAQLVLFKRFTDGGL